ncbi:GNAT family N-acetyltransferase [Pyrodictium abyssi]|uniref:N-acetyltransferase domain-containing protein n=1 Tax=Pyrodictium abyssi TaxID=54256 RepID=A0ABN6ZPT5_9CREN|nr:hypothetical protein PABY_18230 [Pyrodictium abyssi]
MARVVNAAFSRYQWYSPITVRDYANYLGYIEKRYKTLYLLAWSPSGELAGYLQAYINPNLAEGFSGYIEEVAVDPRYQGHGLGSSLVVKTARRLYNETRHVYLNSVRGLEGFYEKLGFAIVDETVYYEASLTLFPERAVTVYTG